MTTISNDLPRSIVAGDTRTFSVTYTDTTSANGWTLFYLLKGETRVKITGTSNGDGWDFTIAANKTENWKERTATYAVYATKGTERRTLARGSIEIYANPENDDYGQRINQLQNDLTRIRAIKSRLALDPKLQMSFGGQSFSRANIDDLLRLETNIAKELFLMKFGHTNVRKTIYGRLGR